MRVLDALVVAVSPDLGKPLRSLLRKTDDLLPADVLGPHQNPVRLPSQAGSRDANIEEVVASEAGVRSAGRVVVDMECLNR
jgi:hypothetical protein